MAVGLAATAMLGLSGADAQTFAPIPDFSGFWGRNAFNYEEPPAGARPVANLMRTGDSAALPIFIGDPVPLVGDYRNPILKPEAAEVVRKRGEMSASGHDFPDPSNQCSTYPPPYLFTIQLGMQMLQSKDEVVILYTQDNQARHVHLNESHPRKLIPTATGHSIGHYEGDTLVVDTVGIKLEPFTMVDRLGTPQSDVLHLVERYRLIDAKDAQAAQERQEKTAGRVGGEPGVAPIDSTFGRGLQVTVTIEDPKMFTAPWSGNVTYRKVRRVWAESVCAENNTDVLHQGFEHVPQALKPDF